MAFDANQPHPETRANFALMVTRPGAMERYWRLAVETSLYQKRLKAARIFNCPTWIEVDEAARVSGYLAQQISEEHHDIDLFSRWSDWAFEFDEIYLASPKWRLKNLISQLSETHSRCSWPNRWEQQIWTWAFSEESAACPFDDRDGILDLDFHQRLRALTEEVGGFLYRCEETGQIVFASTEDLPRIWSHQDLLSAIDRNRPFGFFYDASRPNHRMRAPTKEEKLMLAIMRRRALPKKG